MVKAAVSFSEGCGFFMKITVNGEQFDSNAGTVRQLLDELGIVEGRVAVEVNLSIVKKDEYEEYRLKEGDKVEIVNFVGGGEHFSIKVS